MHAKEREREAKCRSFGAGYVQFLQIFNDHLVDETLTDEDRDCTQSDHGQVFISLPCAYHS